MIVKVMSKPAQLTWPKIWEDATLKYLAQLELAEKAHEHWYKKNKMKRESRETPPEMKSLTAFMVELENQRKKFQGVEDKSRLVLNSMAAIAEPLDLLMSQAGNIAGVFFPGTSLIFGAVMYIFNAGKGVKGYFGVIEQLFSCVTVFIENIRVHVRAERGLRDELENVVIRALVKVLDVLRIASVAVREKALKAFWENLYKDKSGEASSALSDLENLARERDSTVQALTLRSVDDLAEDVIEIREIVHRMEGDMSEVKTELHGVRSDLQGGFQSVQVSIGLVSSEIKRFINHLRPAGDQSDPKPRDNKDTKDAKDAKEDREEKDRESLLRYLDPDQTSSDRLAKLRQTTTPGTAEWILQNPEFGNWIANSETPVLWVSGISGVGKSHLAAKMVEQLELLQAQVIPEGDTAKSRVASFFCDFEISESDDNIQTQNSEHLNIALRTLAWQLTQKDRVYEKWLASRMPNDKDPQTIGELEDSQLWSRLFDNEYFASLQKASAFLVIDGLDTLSEMCRQNLMNLLDELSTKQAETLDSQAEGDLAPPRANLRSNLRVLILGQSKLDDEILTLFKDTCIHHIAITEQENRKDIEEYVSSSLRRSNKLKKLLRDNKFRGDTIEKVTTTSQGCFEMAALMVNELNQKDHLHSFSEALDNSSRDIDQILQDILKHFGHTHTIQEINDLNTLLSWVLYARRPLTLAEVNAAAGLESDHGPFLNIRNKIETEFSAYFAVNDIVQKTSNNRLDEKLDENTDTSANTGQKSEGFQYTEDPKEFKDSEAALLRLTHSSIARFFRSASKVEINSKGISLGVTADEAHTRLLKTCLKLLCSKKEFQTPGELQNADILLKYAADHFLDHLLKLNPSQIPIEERESIVKYLLQVFRDEEVLDRWLKSLSSLPQSSSIIDFDHIWALVSDDTVRQSLSPEEQAWVTAADTSKAQKILEPLIKAISRKWLKCAISDREPYECYFSLDYLKQLIEGVNEQTIKDSTESILQAPELTLASIHKVAEWADPEKTALWHTQVARVSFAYAMFQDALPDCRAAILLDNSLGDAYYYKAVCHAEMKEYSMAIDDMQEAYRLHGHFEDDDKTIGARWLSYWQEFLENTDGAIKVLEDALREYPDDLETVTQYVALTTKTGRFKEVVICLQKLGTKLPDFLLSEKVAEIQRYIRRAAQMTRRVNSLKRAYEIALKRAQSLSNDKEEARARRALFMLRAENQEEDKAIELLKEVYQFEGSPAQLGDWGRYMGSLCELLFWGAYLDGEESETSGEYLKSLIRVEKKEHSPENNALTYDSYLGGIFLGQLYRLHGRKDESKAYFRDRVALAMSLLEDSDISNDWQAYDILSETLFKAGDEVNGTAARIIFLYEWRKTQIDGTAVDTGGELSSETVDQTLGETKISNEDDTSKAESLIPDEVVGSTVGSVAIEESLHVTTQTTNQIQAAKGAEIIDMQLDDNQAVTSTPELANKDSAGPETADDVKPVDGISTNTPWDYSCCDGPCLRDYDKSDTLIHVCMNCFDSTYCDPCFNKYIFTGTLPYKKCDPSHQFASVRGPPKDFDDRQVVIEGSIRDREKWLNSIRIAWGLNEWHPASVTSPTLPGDELSAIESVTENEPQGKTEP